jgi:hypothetical protein
MQARFREICTILEEVVVLPQIDRRHRGLKALLAILATLIVLVVPATAHAASKDIFGMVGSIRADEPDFRQMKAANVSMYRFLVPWPSVQHELRGEFHWVAFDKIVAKMAEQGIEPLPVAWGAARAVTNSQKHKSAWKSFLGTLVNRYKEGGAFWKPRGPLPSFFHRFCHCNAPAVPIDAWQIWNEPNLPKYLPKQMRTPRQYGKLLKISHKTIKKADPKSKTVLAGLAGYSTIRKHPSPKSLPPWKFMKKLYQVNGVKRAFDAAAIDPYGPKLKIVHKLIARTRKQMVKHHDRKTPMWITELGWGSAKSEGKSSLNKGQKGQKRLLKKSFKSILEKRRKWRIQRIFWYTWRDPRTSQNICSFCDTAGLLRSDRTHKPAYNAFVRFTGGS